MGKSWTSYYTEKCADTARCGAVVHAGVRMLWWFRDPRDVAHRPFIAATACKWEVIHFSHLLDISTRGTTRRMVLSLIRKYVTCPDCLVLVDAILEQQHA